MTSAATYPKKWVAIFMTDPLIKVIQKSQPVIILRSIKKYIIKNARSKHREDSSIKAFRFRSKQGCKLYQVFNLNCKVRLRNIEVATGESYGCRTDTEIFETIRS